MTQDKDAADKLLDHNRQQLSALMDGELSPDEARFLLRRLQHDASLAQSLSRWQLCGDLLRGQGHAPAPEGFVEGVAAAIANDRDGSTAAQPAAGWRPARWGTGLALAASVAVVALFVARQTPELATPEGTSQSTQLAALGQAGQLPLDQLPSDQARMPASPTRPAPNPQQPEAPGTAAGVAAVAAVAELPRRAAARRSRGQSQRAATRGAAQRNAPSQVAVAAAAPESMASRPTTAAQATPAQTVSRTAMAAAGERPSTTNASTANPFMPRTDTITTRPWPRALLPAAPADRFNVDYSRQQVAGSGFYPFQWHAERDQEPRMPAGQQSSAPAPVGPATADQSAIEQPAVERAGADTPDADTP